MHCQPMMVQLVAFRCSTAGYPLVLFQGSGFDFTLKKILKGKRSDTLVLIVFSASSVS